LELVYNRISEHKLKDILIDNLLNELNEMIEHDNVVCTQGRFNRILDSINVVDPNVRIISSGDIKREMNNTGNKIYQEMINTFDENTRKIFDKIPENEEDILLNSTFNAAFKSKLKETFSSDYVSTGLMTQEAIDAEINNWEI
jgi:hypothetical protein